MTSSLGKYTLVCVFVYSCVFVCSRVFVCMISSLAVVITYDCTYRLITYKDDSVF